MQQNVAAADVIIAWFFVSLFLIFGNDVIKYCDGCGVVRSGIFFWWGGFFPRGIGEGRVRLTLHLHLHFAFCFFHSFAGSGKRAMSCSGFFGKGVDWPIFGGGGYYQESRLLGVPEYC